MPTESLSEKLSSCSFMLWFVIGTLACHDVVLYGVSGCHAALHCDWASVCGTVADLRNTP